MDDKEFQEYIEKKYPTKYATYCVYDNEGNLIHPDKVFKQGFVFLYENTSYCSRMLKNPTYGEILVLVDDMIEHTQDTDHHFLESIDIVRQTNENTYQISVFLGS